MKKTRNTELAPRHSARRRGNKALAASLGTLLVLLLSGTTYFLGGLYPVNKIIHLNQTSTPTPTKTPTPMPTNSPTDLWNGEGASGLKETNPGSNVAFGENVSVPIDTGANGKSLVEITLKEISTATPEESKALEKSVPQLRGMEIYFSRYTISKLAGAPLGGFDIRPLLSAVTAEGYIVTSLDIANWNKCSYLPLPASIDDAGSSYSFCLASAAPIQGLIPVSGQFAQSGSPYDLAAHGQITWIAK